MIASVRGPCRAGEHRTATSEPQLMPYTEIVMIGLIGIGAWYALEIHAEIEDAKCNLDDVDAADTH